MAEWVRLCFQSTMKIVNSVIGLAGMAMIIYSLWMIRAWIRETGANSSSLSASSLPWFICTFLGLGILLCVIACTGHVAAETINGYCLSCYSVLVILLLVLETALIADIFFNRIWEEDFPRDSTGRLDEFEDFVRSNFDLCRLVGVLVVAAQALSVILAMALRALGPNPGYYYDSDDDSVPARLPLLKKQAQNTPYISNPSFLLKKDHCNINIFDKISTRN